MRTAIYARVSTEHQTADNQLLSLRAYAAARGLEVVAEYVDVASGGKADAKRPRFDQMMSDARRARFQLLLFWSLDRISRRGVFHTLDVLQSLSHHGVKILALQQPFLDTTGAMGPAIIALFAALAQTERDLLIERTKAGLERARKNGRQLGRPRRVADVVRIREMKQGGATWEQIAAATALSVPTAKRRLYQSQESQPRADQHQ